MLITTNITVGSGNFLYDEAGAAAQVLAALGGNSANDESEAAISEVTLLFAVSVILEEDDRWQYTAAEAATQVLAALGGNPTTDTCQLTVRMPTASGEAGVSGGE